MEVQIISYEREKVLSTIVQAVQLPGSSPTAGDLRFHLEGCFRVCDLSRLCLDNEPLRPDVLYTASVDQDTERRGT